MGGSTVQPKSKFIQKQNIYDTPLLRVGGWVGLGPFFKTEKETRFGTASICVYMHIYIYIYIILIYLIIYIYI